MLFDTRERCRVFRSKSVGMMPPSIQEIPSRLVRSGYSRLVSLYARFDQCRTIVPKCVMTNPSTFTCKQPVDRPKLL